MRRSKQTVNRGMELTNRLAVPWGLDDGWELTAGELLLSIFFFFWSLISWQRCARIVRCWQQSCSDFEVWNSGGAVKSVLKENSLKWVVKAKRDISLLFLSRSHIYIQQRVPDFICHSIKRQNIGWRTVLIDRYAIVMLACLLEPEQW